MDGLQSHLTDQIERSKGFFWHRLRWKAVSENLPRGRPFRLLDIGAGAGLIGEFLRRDFPDSQYMFIEPLEQLENHLESVHGPRANAAKLTSYDGVDVITLLDVIEHVDDAMGFFEGVVDRASEGTTIVVTVPALQRLWSSWDVALGHYRRYDKKMLRSTFANLPLKELEVAYLFPELLPAALVRKSRRSRNIEGADEALFPVLPRWVDRSLYGLGLASLRLRRIWPAGTSLLGVFRRTK
jgi:hypothetical protein